MCCVVDFRKNVLVFNRIVTLLSYPILCLHLDHFSTLANEIKASRHHLRFLLLNRKEALELQESYVFDRAFNRHVDDCGHFRQDR